MKMVDYAALPINPNELKFRALGGPVSRNEPYIVGEVGPELFVPNNNGTIVPNNDLSFNNEEIVAKLDQLIQAVSKGAVLNVQATKENTECIEQAISNNTTIVRTQNRIGIR
jgi:DNA phosphorothioation-dependent restriction protein DptG